VNSSPKNIKQKGDPAIRRRRRSSAGSFRGRVESVMSKHGRTAGARFPAGKPSRPGRRPPCSWGEHVWREERVAARPGWWRGWCDACGKFLGYRQGEAPRISGEPHPGGVWQ